MGSYGVSASNFQPRKRCRQTPDAITKLPIREGPQRGSVLFCFLARRSAFFSVFMDRENFVIHAGPHDSIAQTMATAAPLAANPVLTCAWRGHSSHRAGVSSARACLPLLQLSSVFVGSLVSAASVHFSSHAPSLPRAWAAAAL